MKRPNGEAASTQAAADTNNSPTLVGAPTNITMPVPYTKVVGA
jgi:hypothetical protein